jgi:hypothetical protein
MSDREKLLVKLLLKVLANVKQCDADILEASVGLSMTPPITRTEFETALRYCDGEGWLTSVPGKFGSTKWSLNDAGKAAQKEI